MIIDVHAHLGVDRVFDEICEEKEIIDAMDENKIDVTIVQTMFGTVELDRIRANHDRVYKFSLDNPGKIFGMVTTTPLINEADYYNEAKRCIKELNFVGIKLHPAAHAVNPGSKVGRYVWEVCKDLNVPLMVHTGTGIPFSLPAMTIKRAKEFSDVKCILSHSGFVYFAGEAFLAAEESSNIYLETSWTAPYHIEKMVKKFGAHRIMFATDQTANIPIELAKYKSIELTDDEKEWCLWKTANEVYNLGF